MYLTYNIFFIINFKHNFKYTLIKSELPVYLLKNSWVNKMMIYDAKKG